MKIDFLIKNCSQLLTLYGEPPKRGKDMLDLKIIEGGWLGSYGGQIRFIGTEGMFKNKFKLSENAKIIDAKNKICMPGLVDPHTHLPFGGDRAEEFKMKLDGVSYMELQKQGAGIKSTVKATREIELQKLVNISQARLDDMVRGGVTTIEAKSGYGLDLDTEIKQLEAIKVLRDIHPVDIVPTYLGGHDIPPDSNKEEYLEKLTKNYIPEIGKRKRLAEFFDAFIEEGIYNKEEIKEMLKAAKENGFKIKLHADEFTDQGGAKLATEFGARSAEHLINISQDGIEALSKSDTAAIILPGVLFFLRLESKPPVREMINKNIIMALGSDFNPGSSHINNMLFIMRLAVFLEDFKMEEAITASTINAAYSIEKEKEVGSLMPGKKMDVLIFNTDSFINLFYEPSKNHLEYVIKEGEVILKNCELKY